MSRKAGQNNIASGFLKKVLAKNIIFRLLFSFRPKSSRGRANSMGGALRRPANSGIGANLQNRSNLFYQKLLMIESSGGGKKKGLKGKMNCRHCLRCCSSRFAGLALHQLPPSSLASLAISAGRQSSLPLVCRKNFRQFYFFFFTSCICFLAWYLI